MPEKSSTTKEKCGKDCRCCKSVFPVCLLACVMTAALVSLGFTVGIVATVSYNTQNDYVIHSAGQFAKEVSSKRAGKITRLSSSGVIDFYTTEQTGFIYAATGDCASCASFEERLNTAAKEQGVIDQTYKYVFPANPSNLDKYAHERTIATDDGPVLIYIRDGHVYDRLDEVNGDLSISTFLAKYK